MPTQNRKEQVTSDSYTFTEATGADMVTNFAGRVTGITFDDKQGSIIFGEDIPDRPSSFIVNICLEGAYGTQWFTDLFIHLEGTSIKKNIVYQFERE